MGSMTFQLRDERGTLARVARILRKQEPPLTYGSATVAFDMGDVFYVAESGLRGGCGSAACIGGHAILIENPSFSEEDIERAFPDREHPLGALYYAFTSDGAERYADDITDEQAALAIDNYLATGKPDWDAVLFGERPAQEVDR